MTRLTIRIDFSEENAIGPGKARLLECVDREGSIRGAANAMAMSYRRAWLLLEEIGALAGGPVVTASTGGAHGGGTKLTAIGRAVVTHYRRIERQAHRSTRREIAALEHLLKKPSTQKRRSSR